MFKFRYTDSYLIRQRIILDMKYSVFAVFIFISMLMLGCKDQDSPNAVIKDITISSSKQVCQAVSQSLCMVIVGSDENTFELFYDPIEGFNYTWGTTHSITVEETFVANPPADGSSIRTTLVSVISQLEDPIGTQYNYENVDLLEMTFSIDAEGNFHFLNEPIVCPQQTLCEQLLSIVDMGAIVKLRFEYIGNDQIALIDYN